MSSVFGHTMFHKTVRGFEGWTEQQLEDLLRQNPGMNRHEGIRRLEVMNQDPKTLPGPISAARSKLEEAEAERNHAEQDLRMAFEAKEHLEILQRQLKTEQKYLDRGILQLDESRSLVEGFEASFDDWPKHEEISTGGFIVVSNSVSALLIHRELAARLPGWLEMQTARVTAAQEALTKFAADNGFEIKAPITAEATIALSPPKCSGLITTAEKKKRS